MDRRDRHTYATVFANLKVHHPDYPTPEDLRPRITWGNVGSDGDYSKDTDGSNLITSLLLDDSRPSATPARGAGR